MYGKIKFFDKLKHFGFITEDDTNKDWFFHISGLVDPDVWNGDKVSFIEGVGKKGESIAVKVTKL